MTPDLSVLIVNWNTRELTFRCLDSLAGAADASIAYEVIVVDNGSADGSAEALEKRSDVALVRNGNNLGYAAAVNQAYRRSAAELVLLLNSDVDLRPASLSALVSFLREHPEVAGAAPLYRNPDGTPQPFHFRFPTFMTLLAVANPILRLLPGNARRARAYRMVDEDFSKARCVPQPSASCLLLRRASLPPDGVFDERYPIFFNDVQLARTLYARGEELWVTPDAVVTHEQGASTRLLGASLKRQYLGSLIRMLEETEPARYVWIYRALTLMQGLSLILLRRPNALPVGELWKALTGDPGPVPQAPVGVASS